MPFETLLDTALPVLDGEAFAESAPNARVRSLMAAAFERQLPMIVGELEAGAGEQVPFAQWQDAVHKLKGSCATLGARRLADVLARWEQMAATSTPTDRRRANESLLPELARLSDELRKYLN
ncbi:Hpt domain-containing protein [Variovorax sp. VNK109]|uniref:Hpt domain-containing protein n=1 Tax=Variovorax sp. VNK109 TaxID=3400919 RepID=UPI003C0120F4